MSSNWQGGHTSGGGGGGGYGYGLLSSGGGAVGNSPSCPSLVELLKLALLAAALTACGASWFYDPFAPTNAGPGGFLELPMDLGGFKAQAPCNALRAAAAQCRKEHPPTYSTCACLEQMVEFSLG